MTRGEGTEYFRSRMELGMKGELLAVGFLEKKGYLILERNLMVGHSDIDILARDGESLVFVEVRTKSRSDRGMPEESLSVKKLGRMKKTAEHYMARHHYNGPARLDAVCIILDGYGTLRHFEHYLGVGER